MTGFSENPDENLKTAPPNFLSMALDGWRDYENLICEKRFRFQNIKCRFKDFI